jgi:hypothetical protein
MTSVELDPRLLHAARGYARIRGIPLRALIDEALRERLARREDTTMAPRRRGRTS